MSVLHHSFAIIDYDSVSILILIFFSTTAVQSDGGTNGKGLQEVHSVDLNPCSSPDSSLSTPPSVIRMPSCEYNSGDGGDKDVVPDRDLSRTLDTGGPSVAAVDSNVHLFSGILRPPPFPSLLNRV